MSKKELYEDYLSGAINKNELYEGLDEDLLTEENIFAKVKQKVSDVTPAYVKEVVELVKKILVKGGIAASALTGTAFLVLVVKVFQSLAKNTTMKGKTFSELGAGDKMKMVGKAVKFAASATSKGNYIAAVKSL